MVKDGIGLVLQVGRYRGPVNGQNWEAEVPLATGTCFAVSQNGLLLTNRHAVSLPSEASPPTLAELNLPTMVLTGRTTIVCFGREPSSHFEASVLHLTSRYDLALLKVDRIFKRPFSLGLGPATMGEQIFVGGYPSAVSDILAEANAWEVILKFFSQVATGTMPYAIWFDKGVYDPTLTAGIVSNTQRQLTGALYLQFDAKVSAGNSGGPVLNRNNEAIGIVTLAGTTLEAQGYNFAIPLPQIMDEIRPYLQTR